ncbi:hypothetical protein BJX65DRAFT_314643 [Aspergillus insuetus]
MTRPNTPKATTPDVELPVYNHNGLVPSIGDMGRGYTAIGGWMFEAVGLIVEVGHRPGVNHPDGFLAWVKPIADRIGHSVIPYHTPELAMSANPGSWNWEIPRNRHKPLPGVGAVADEVWDLPDGSCFVGSGRVFKVQCEPYRVVFK